MSEEIQKVTDPAAYLATLQKGLKDESLEDLAAEANPFDIMPRLKLDNELKKITAIQAGEEVASFGSSKPLYMVLMLMSEHRALWRPDGTGTEEQQADKFPVCSTERVRIGTFRREDDRGIGSFRVASNRDLPGPNGIWQDDDYAEGEWPETVDVQCAICPFNQFGSMQDWDQNRTGKGKACGEGRLIVGYVCEKVGELGGDLDMFAFDPNGSMFFMNVPSSSIKTIKKIGTALVGRKVPPRYAVFRLGNDPQKEGQFKWGVLTADLAGFIAPNLINDADEIAESLKKQIIVDQVAPVTDEEMGF